MSNARPLPATQSVVFGRRLAYEYLAYHPDWMFIRLRTQAFANAARGKPASAARSGSCSGTTNSTEKSSMRRNGLLACPGRGPIARSGNTTTNTPAT
jgi:hypothetical protein